MSITGTYLRTKLVQSRRNFRCMFTSIMLDTDNPLKKVEEKKEKATLQVLLRPPNMKARKLKSRNNLTGEDWIPGSLYGSAENEAHRSQGVAMSKRDIEKLIRTYGVSIENTLVELTVFEQSIDSIAKDPIVVNSSGKSTVVKAVPRQIDYDPLSDAPRSVNFLLYKPGQTRLRIPIKYINEEDCVDYKKGGHRVDVNRFLECVCSSDDIPLFVAVDMSDKKIGDVIKLKDMNLPKHIRPSLTVDATQFVASVIKSVAK